MRSNEATRPHNISIDAHALGFVLYAISSARELLQLFYD